MKQPSGTASAGAYRWLGFIAVVALFALTLSWYLLSQWSQVSIASDTEAKRAFEEAIRQAGSGAPYVTVSRDGVVSVHRELEQPRPVALRSLHLLAWEPAGKRLVRITFPFWFVRVKMTDSFNLGTLTSALARDWQHLDLRVSEQDLQKRGPGIVLDHSLPDGRRLLVWSESK